MNKAELVEEVAGKAGLTKKDANNVIDAMTSAITDSLVREEKVTLVGFGTFQVVERKARRGVNPQTGKTIEIPAKKVPKFKPGKELREKVK
ncbi:HU family DNA-binding protein [Candidatus Bathyarchaeota archaeon]|nr:MAG: HU family DNA-binding protein [Candidatus Bathyarchaeota archaeon]